LYDVEVIFKYMMFLYCNIWSADSTNEGKGHTQRLRQYKQSNDGLYGNLSYINFNIAMLFACPCLSVRSILTSEPCDRLLLIWCEHYDDLGGTM